MKLPKIFILDRTFDQKIEELKEGTKEISIEKLLENDMRILYGSAGQHSYKRDEINKNAFDRIIKDTFEGKIKWKKDMLVLERYTAHATIINHQGIEIVTPLMFHTDDYPSHGIGPLGKERWGYLHIGDERGPCKNSFYEGVKKLATEYFQLELDKPKRKIKK